MQSSNRLKACAHDDECAGRCDVTNTDRSPQTLPRSQKPLRIESERLNKRDRHCASAHMACGNGAEENVPKRLRSQPALGFFRFGIGTLTSSSILPCFDHFPKLHKCTDDHDGPVKKDQDIAPHHDRRRKPSLYARQESMGTSAPVRLCTESRSFKDGGTSVLIRCVVSTEPKPASLSFRWVPAPYRT